MQDRKSPPLSITGKTMAGDSFRAIKFLAQGLPFKFVIATRIMTFAAHPIFVGCLQPCLSQKAQWNNDRRPHNLGD